MRIVGISPLKRNSAVCLVEDGKVVAAIAEERFSLQKMNAGFPRLALQDLFTRYQLTPDNIDYVVYACSDATKEARLIKKGQSLYAEKIGNTASDEVFSKFRKLPRRHKNTYTIPGLSPEELFVKNPWYVNTAYSLITKFNVLGNAIQKRRFDTWGTTTVADHERYEGELLQGLEQFGLKKKLVRRDHHLSLSANAYYMSGFEKSLIVTLDGYGNGLAGNIAIGKEGKIERIHKLFYPASLSEFFEQVTLAFGFRPGYDEGKIVGLAAYGDPDFLFDTIKAFFEVKDGNILSRLPHHGIFARYLVSRYPKPDVAAAYQKVLEQVACEYVSFYQQKTGLNNLVVAGGIAANTKLNQRLFEIPGIRNIFIHPATGNEGSCIGAALLLTAEKEGLAPYNIYDVYWGPNYSEEELQDALVQEGLHPEKPDNLEKKIAELLADGKIVARFDGRMEYGPHGLGNRSILYHAKDPGGNQWLNAYLKRMEFMLFAPATLYEERERCYKNLQGAEYTACFMTITCECTDFMREQCPAAVHVDGTACPQLVRRKTNENFYRIIKEYYTLTGNPSIINTSFNLPGEPLVCTPYDAIRVFKLGQLQYLAMGPYLVKGMDR
jgi:carbamoyltransferase